MLFLKKLWDCLTIWHLPPSPNFLRAGDVIITHAGGDSISEEPGLINEYLAGIVREIHRKTKLPIIAQGEVAQCLSDLGPYLHGNIQRQRDSKRDRNGYIDSIDVAAAHLKACREHGWKRPILVSYQPHLFRAMMVSKKAGLDVLIAPVPDVVFYHECSQFQARSALLNYPYELAVRMYWLLQGKI